MIAILDYGIGNIASIRNMFKKLGIPAKSVDNVPGLEDAQKIILPGVGAFDHGMTQLKRSGLLETLQDKVLNEGIPVLGICLGAQLLTKSSSEGIEVGLSWIPGRCVPFDKSRLTAGLKVPHMGWADVKGYDHSRLFTGMYDNPKFYFVHSYHLLPDEAAHVIAVAEHGYEFAAGLEYKNILGVQFHPEKSHKYGMKIFENFANYY